MPFEKSISASFEGVNGIMRGSIYQGISGF